MSAGRSSNLKAQNTLKRRWLRARGALATPRQGEASTSHAVSQTSQASAHLRTEDVQEILSKVSENSWVIKACLAEIDQAADGELDEESDGLSALLAIIGEGVKRAEKSSRTENAAGHILGTLEGLRQRLKALSSVSDDAGQSASTASAAGPREPAVDGWDLDEIESPDQPTAPESPSPNPPLSVFLQPLLYDVASSLIVSGHYAYLGAVLHSRDLADQLRESRYDLAELIIFSASNASDIEHAFASRLLPQLDEHGDEQSAWLSRSAEDPGADTRRMPGERLLEWYQEKLSLLAESQASSDIILAATSHILDRANTHAESSAFKELSDLRHRVQLQNVLSRGFPTSSPVLSAPLAADEEGGIQALLADILNSTQPEDAPEVCSTSIIPLLRFLATRPSASGRAEHSTEFVHERLRTMLFALAHAAEEKQDDKAFPLACALLGLGSPLRPELGDADMQRLRLSIGYSSGRTDTSSLAQLERMLDSPPSGSLTSSQSGPSDFARHLGRVCLIQSSSASFELISPEALFRLTARGTVGQTEDLSSLLDELQVCLKGAKALSDWRGTSPIAWYACCLDAGEKRKRLNAAISGKHANAKSDAQWKELAQALLEGDTVRAFLPLEAREIASIVLRSTLEAGQISTFRDLTQNHSVAHLLSSEQIERVVLQASFVLYDRATAANHHKGELKIAHDVVTALSSSSSLKQEREFIEATSRLGSYKLRSRHHTGLPLLPSEIRSAPNRMDLIAALLSSQDDAYRAWESILDLALKLNAGARSMEGGTQELPPPKALIEARTLAMLCEAAIAAQDFKRASTLGNRLVSSITNLRKRAAAAAANAANHGDAEEQSSHSFTATEMLPEAEELGWKTCYQLAKHPGWDDYRSRLQFMGQVLALCPKERIPSMTRKWNQLYDQAKEEGSAEENLFFAKGRESTKGSVGLGSLVDAYASPFASLLANAGTRTASRSRITGIPPTPNTADSFARTPTGGAFGGRGAQLLDALAGSEHFDPAERAARAARNFFGGLAGAARHASGASQSTAGGESRNTSFGSGAFSFSKGVGWLLGEEEKR